MIKAVLFDLDDTLYTSFAELNARGYDAVSAWVERELGIPAAAFREQAVEARRYYHRILHAEPESHDRVVQMQRALEHFGANPMKYAQKLHEIYWDTLIAGMERRPGTPELLDALRAQGIKTAVCTNMMADRQMEKIVKLGLADKFDAFVASEEAGIDKPAPRIFELCLEKCGCRPQEAIMVGDNRDHDVGGALAVGLHGVWLNWTGKPPARFPWPHYEAADMQGAGKCIYEILKKEGNENAVFVSDAGHLLAENRL